MSDFILFTESSPNVGGQELQLMQQMKLLEGAGYRPVLACRPGTRVAEVAEDKGLAILPFRFRNSAHPSTMLGLWRWMAAHRPALAICHSGHDCNNLALAARLLPKRPFLLRSRTYQAGYPSAWTYNRLVDATMLPSECLRQALLRNPAIRPERLHVVYPGIDFARLDLAAERPLPENISAWLAREQGPVLVHAAMLRGEKGHRVLLQALAALREQWPTLRYVIAGEGGERGAIEGEIERLGLRDRVLLAGVVDPIAPLLRRADIVVMPSTYEPLGMSQIESLGLGVPVVASRTGGIPETVSDGVSGLLAAPGDVGEWTQALGRALSDLPGMRAMADAGRHDVRQRFSVEHNLDSILQLAGLPRQARG
ncbi:glycosyltransferase family 4 protein [Chromobacterium violaceum]|nr:glycosyltransferase family 4 protein [Chromobacterium violaceum]MBP4044638.1 glycosyltransferase family 4 protein [Chromobacterium violaceum]QIY78773.1 glycosyltransferase family 4 protein [Chromobacterium violaceum]SUX39919.1 Glycogen synthase [Chromobacterium violaceum]